MKQILLIVTAIFTFALHAHSKAGVQTKEVEYNIAGVPFKGFLATPSGKGPFPGVVVVHEWWGHNAYARKRAKMLAELGYVAFALDMYGKDKHSDEPKGAEHLMTEALSSGQIQSRFDEALNVIKRSPQADSTKIAAIGYCFGGNVVLSMARAGEPLKAVVSFHGSLPPKGNVSEGSVKSEVLVLHGAEDQFVSKEAMDTFKSEMDKAKANYRVIVYPNAKHGFTDPDNSSRGEMHHIPIGYNKEADTKSWNEMKTLFKRVFQ